MVGDNWLVRHQRDQNTPRVGTVLIHPLYHFSVLNGIRGVLSPNYGQDTGYISASEAA